MKYLFERTDELAYGCMGWLPLWREDFDATEDVAHDILEHPCLPHHACVVDELMAFGAIIAGRGQSGTLSPNLSPTVAEIIANDISHLFLNNWISTLPAPPILCLSGPVGEMVDKVVTLVFPEGGQGIAIPEHLVWVTSHHQSFIRGWLWHGFALWNQRFNNPDPTTYANLYQEINERVKALEHDSDVGAELTVDIEGLDIRSITCIRWDSWC